MGPKSLPCGNPLWAEWLQELADEMKAKGSKSEKAYHKVRDLLSPARSTASGLPKRAYALSAPG